MTWKHCEGKDVLIPTEVTCIVIISNTKRILVSQDHTRFFVSWIKMYNIWRWCLAQQPRCQLDFCTVLHPGVAGVQIPALVHVHSSEDSNTERWMRFPNCCLRVCSALATQTFVG